MSYIALYRKWRPAVFGEVKGQDHIVQTLKNQIKSGRIGHAYLFCGTRGTGKTSIAKIFARAVNCEHPVDGSPCNECQTCKAILAGSSMNVVEIDAASNNSVDNVREIREQVQYPPTEGRYRVYIIDEVHMLSPSAFNALLKTLEEPPSYVIFILATTEVHKIPITVLSRCQRYDFKRISIDVIASRLQELTQAEQLSVEERALRYIARMAEGSMRDALSLLDQCVAFHYGKRLRYEDVLDVLGTVDSTMFGTLLRAVLEKRTADCIRILEEMVAQGREPELFVTDFIWYLRNILIIKNAEDAEDMLEMSEENVKLLREDAKLIGQGTIMRFIRVLSELSNQLRYASQKRILIEVALIKLTKPQMEQEYDAVLQRMEELEEQMAAQKKLIEVFQAKAMQGLSVAASAVMPQGQPAPESAALPSGKTLAASWQASVLPKAQPPEKIYLPKAEYEDLMQIKKEWAKITRDLGEAIRPAFRETQLEPDGEGSLRIVFQTPMNYEIGNRPTILAQIEEYVKEHYHKDIYFKVRLSGSGEPTNKIYLSDEEIEKAIHTEIETEDCASTAAKN